jgi:predicted O-methyltransferase YrrM
LGSVPSYHSQRLATTIYFGFGLTKRIVVLHVKLVIDVMTTTVVTNIGDAAVVVAAENQEQISMVFVDSDGRQYLPIMNT